MSLEETIIISAISTAGIVTTLVLSIRASKRAEKAHFVSFFYQFTKDHSQLIQAEGNMGDCEECELHALSYMDLLDHFTYLCLNGYVNEQTGLQYKRYFEYVQLMKNWYEETVGFDDNWKADERWPSIKKWVTKYDIKPDTDLNSLPERMRILWELLKINKDFSQLLAKYREMTSEKDLKKSEIEELKDKIWSEIYKDDKRVNQLQKTTKKDHE